MPSRTIAIFWTVSVAVAQETTRIDPFPGAAWLGFDARRGCLVALHGRSNVFDAWELHGASWLLRDRVVATTQPPVFYHDDSSGETVVVPVDRTGSARTWDGLAWSVQPAFRNGPPALYGAASAWDPQQRRLVLFGGHFQTGTGVALSDQTWLWDGAQWQRFAGAMAPRSRSQACMAFDPVRSEIVLFGGFDGLGASQTFLADTWVHDGVQWLARQVPGPSPRVGASMAWDPARQRVVLVGGNGVAGALGDEWLWDGTGWTPTGVPAPTVGGQQSMATIPGGIVRTTRDGLGSRLWQRGPNGWLLRVQDEQPSARDQGAIVADSRRDQLVFFGGGLGQIDLADTWLWNGRWRAVAPAVSPPARRGHAMAFDEARGEAVMFGGNAAGVMVDDTWTFDGSTWTPHVVASRPPGRTGPGLAWHAGTGDTVLFGGLASTGSLGDMWLWNGSAWRAHAGTLPAPRHDHAVVGDPARGVVVLQGGIGIGAGGVGLFSDTWLWDGTTWTPHAATLFAGARTGWYDPTAGGVVIAAAGLRYRFDGTGWHLLDTATIVPLGSRRPLARHGGRDRVLVMPGSSLPETYVIGPTPAVVERDQEACGVVAPLRPVRLAAGGRPRIGEFEFRFELDGVSPLLPQFLLLGLSDQGPSVGGCQLRVAGLVATIPGLTDANGLAVVPMPIPDQLGIRGLRLFAQAAVLVPGGPAAGFALSHGLQVRVGD